MGRSVKLGCVYKYIAASPLLSKKLIVWDAESGKLLNSKKGEKSIYNIHISKNLKYIISAGLKTVTLWNIENNFSFITFEPFTSVVSGIETIGDYIILSGMDKSKEVMFRIFNYSGQLEKSIKIESFKLLPDFMSFNRNGNLLFGIDGAGRSITMWKVEK